MRAQYLKQLPKCNHQQTDHETMESKQHKITQTRLYIKENLKSNFNFNSQQDTFQNVASQIRFYYDGLFYFVCFTNSEIEIKIAV